jgi:hypothetical protein
MKKMLLLRGLYSFHFLKIIVRYNTPYIGKSYCILRYDYSWLIRETVRGGLNVKLPNPEKTLISREKIEGYLLSPLHLVGRHKAAFFGSLGYTQSEWRTLERDVRRLVTGNARLVAETEYGKKYEIHGLITGPNGRSVTIVTAWIVHHGEDFPRFITAYPED